MYSYFALKDLQNVNITLRILFRPVPKELPKLYTSLGEDYDERVLPSITNEILKAVVVRLIFQFLLLLFTAITNVWENIICRLLPIDPNLLGKHLCWLRHLLIKIPSR